MSLQASSQGTCHRDTTENGRPVQFELTEQTREAIRDWLSERRLQDGDSLFPNRVHHCSHLSTRQYARIVDHWVASIGLDPHKYGTAFDAAYQDSTDL